MFYVSLNIALILCNLKIFGDTMNIEYAKIAVIGTGYVGSTIAYSLIAKDIAGELLLVDINQNICNGNVLDLEDTLFFSMQTTHVTAATYAQAAEADIIIICAGIAQKPGQSRIDLLETNKKVLHEIAQQLTPLNPNAVVLVVTNPVDILTWYMQQWLPLPKNQVIGSGTYIDSIRFGDLIGKKINVNPQNIYAYIFGEHGDTQVPIWSNVFIDGTKIDEYRPFFKKSENPPFTQQEKDVISQETKNRAYEIISCKGATNFGIAACVTAICQAIVWNKQEIPVSFYQPKYDVCMSAMALVGPKGVEKEVPHELSPHEEELLELSAKAIKKYLK